MQEILAKSKSSWSNKAITLSEHTKGLLEQLEKFREILSNQVFDYELLKLAIFAHDIGKVSPSFQISVGNWDYSPKVPFPDIPHSLFSLLWIDKEKLTCLVTDENNLKILLSAVAFHHWRNNFHNIILGNDRDFIRAIEQILLNNELKTKLLENLKYNFKSQDFLNYSDILGFDEDIASTIRSGNDLFSYIIPPYYSYFLPQRISVSEDYKKKWIYTAGLLMRIDHFTSFIQEEEISEEIEMPFSEYDKVKTAIKNKLSKKLKKPTLEETEIWQIIEAQDKRDKNIILIAPTGSGKTEFAYLWSAGSKLFITLPIRSAVNSIYERSEEIFGEENVALLHSDADIYLYEKSSNQEGENFRILDLAKQFAFPVLVSTGDQLFPSALKYPGYEKIYATLGYSKLVIDEVQAYDPKAVAIIVKLIEDAVKFGGKFLLMTATLPPFVKEQLKERVGEENFVLIDKYSDYDCICKHKIKICEDDILKKVDEMLQKAKEGNRVLVILNTVEMAQKIYNDIAKANKKNIYLKLIHSKFTFNDRKNLELEIAQKFKNPKPDDEKEGKILVATQVVEASLDIDADILYTELAPIDLLIQRMGRVLRRIKDVETFKKYLEAEESQEPNIFIFYQRPNENTKLCSGAGNVYEKDLLAFSLALLFEKAMPEFEGKIDQLNKKYWSEGKDKKGKSKAKELLKGFLEDLFKAIDTNQPHKSKRKNEKEKLQTQTNFVFSISETDKKTLVENLYRSLPSDSGYLQRFYETLDILDAGYMSDRKQEALKIFREIYTVPAISKNRQEEFKQFIEDFLKTRVFNYTNFKICVLSEFVVNIDIRKYLYNNSLNLPKASYLAYEIKNLSDEKIDKIKKWLSGVYIFDEMYDKNIGVIFDRKREKNGQYSGIIDI